jgi:NCS1 family nucleobase:cation symporter-1
VTAFVLAYAAAIPFMNTTLIGGPIAKAWHGADIAYFVNLLVAAGLYGGYRLLAAPTDYWPLTTDFQGFAHRR